MGLLGKPGFGSTSEDLREPHRHFRRNASFPPFLLFSVISSAARNLSSSCSVIAGVVLGGLGGGGDEFADVDFDAGAQGLAGGLQ